MNNSFKVAASILHNSATNLSGRQPELCEREILNKAGGETHVQTEVWSITSDNPAELAAQLRIAAEISQTDKFVQILTSSSAKEEYSVACNDNEIVIAPVDHLLKEQVEQAKIEQDLPDTAIQDAERTPLKAAGASRML